MQPPETFGIGARSEAELEAMLSSPGERLVEAIKSYSSPLVVLGAGGKMGPTLCAMAQRAATMAGHTLKVIAVSRFTNDAARQRLEAQGITTKSCDLLERDAFAALPESENLVYLVGLKFGTANNPGLTWAMNTLVPARVCERYPRSRIVALSTGNVYGMSDVAAGGATEEGTLNPVGEYPSAALGRERIFEYCSRRHGTPITLLRLFYAVELRYGVLVDIARRLHAGEAISLATGYFNCIWQRDANEAALRAIAFAASPPAVFNVCRPEVFSVRDVAGRLGKLLGRPPVFAGDETGTALLGNANKLTGQLGEPATHLESMLELIARWVQAGGRNLGRPTHFEVRDGIY